jgi:1,4-alpha-glucan branching enzyme
MRKKSEKKSEVKLNAAQKNKSKITNKSGNSGIRKQYLKLNGSCKVTFRLPKEAAQGARSVTIAGDFNNWDATNTQLKRLKNGEFKLIMELPRNKEYRFKYLIDSKHWENDWHADKYVPNSYGSDDSVVVVQ